MFFGPLFTQMFNKLNDIKT